ncbi:hypothetical protein CJD36_021040 [Flavipsychrobacter stenotrophus]|uniref:Lipoprotein n=1 Tax=Flavipsychrobacter stenotrophus TaxID=2077091 RepID=A0A2S7SR24_9BACT|nr:hypothetical protein [Flavipsychrobacter stenotrophus]PQJ09065.1 hypothetical protein CJD36_021040 [Flavipsychrobacter stenotrophus]
MKRHLSFLLFIITGTILTGCDSISFHTIDEKPQIKVDTNLLGLWETDQHEFYLVQTFDEVYKPFPEIDKKDSGYVLEEHNKVYLYYLTEIGERKMAIPLFMAFMSKTSKGMFANICAVPRKTLHHREPKSAYFFVKIKIDKAHKEAILTPLFDTTLHVLTSSAQVKERLEQDADKILQPRSNMIFKKISNKHASVKEAQALAHKLWRQRVDMQPDVNPMQPAKMIQR